MGASCCCLFRAPPLGALDSDSPWLHLALSRHQLDWPLGVIESTPLQYKDTEIQKRAKTYLPEIKQGGKSRVRTGLGTGLTWMLWVSPWSQPPLFSFCFSGRHQKGTLG